MDYSLLLGIHYKNRPIPQELLDILPSPVARPAEVSRTPAPLNNVTLPSAGATPIVINASSDSATSISDESKQPQIPSPRSRHESSAMASGTQQDSISPRLLNHDLNTPARQRGRTMNFDSEPDSEGPSYVLIVKAVSAFC